MLIMIGVWLVGQCSKTLRFVLKIPGMSRPHNYFDDRPIYVPMMILHTLLHITLYYKQGQFGYLKLPYAQKRMNRCTTYKVL